MVAGLKIGDAIAYPNLLIPYREVQKKKGRNTVGIREELIAEKITKPEFIEDWYKLQLEDEYMRKKYNHAGVYVIMIDDIIVYIGKSTDMLKRTAQHLGGIYFDTITHKYKILYEAKEKGHTLQFDVLYDSPYINSEATLVDIGYQEALWINELQPPLNYQLPKLHNYKSFTVNKKAQVITLDEILQH